MVDGGTIGVTVETLPGKRKRALLSEEAKKAKTENDRNRGEQEGTLDEHSFNGVS